MANLPIQQFRLQDPQRFNQGGESGGMSFFNGLGQGLASGAGVQGMQLGFGAARAHEEAILADQRQYQNSVKLSYLRDSIAEADRKRRNEDILGYGSVLESEGKPVVWSGSGGQLGFSLQKDTGVDEGGDDKRSQLLPNIYRDEGEANKALEGFLKEGKYKAGAVIRGEIVEDGVKVPIWQVKVTGVQGAGGGGSARGGGKTDPNKATSPEDLIRRFNVAGRNRRRAAGQVLTATRRGGTPEGAPIPRFLAPPGEGGGTALTTWEKRIQDYIDANPEYMNISEVAEAAASAADVSVDDLMVKLAQSGGVEPPSGPAQPPKPPQIDEEGTLTYSSDILSGIGDYIKQIQTVMKDPQVTQREVTIAGVHIDRLMGYRRAIDAKLEALKAEKDKKKRARLIADLDVYLDAAATYMSTASVSGE